MQAKAFIVLFGASLTLAGCASSHPTSGTTPTPPDLTGNWQIQSNVISNTVPPAGVLLLGALQSTENQVAGTFRFTNLAQPTACGLDQVVTVTGSVDSKNNLTLASSSMPNGTTVKVLLVISSSQQPYAGTGSIEVDGSTCTFPSTGAIGQQTQNIAGTFTGTLTPGTLVSPGTGPSATASLTIAQSANPQSDGQFPATGSFNYTIGSCSGNVSLSGTVSGVGVTLSGTSGTFQNPQIVTFIGTSNPAATAISAGLLVFAPAPCSSDPTSEATYSGTMNRQ